MRRNQSSKEWREWHLRRDSSMHKSPKVRQSSVVQEAGRPVPGERGKGCSLAGAWKEAGPGLCQL